MALDSLPGLSGGSDGGKKEEDVPSSPHVHRLISQGMQKAEQQNAPCQTIINNLSWLLSRSRQRKGTSDSLLMLLPLSYTRSHVIHCTCCSGRWGQRPDTGVFEERLIALNDLLPPVRCSVKSEKKGKDCRTTHKDEGCLFGCTRIASECSTKGTKGKDREKRSRLSCCVSWKRRVR